MAGSSGSKIPIVAAVVLGLLSVIAINKYITSKTSLPEEKKASILVAASNIGSGVEIEMKDLKVRTVPAETVSDVNVTVPSGNSAEVLEEVEKVKMLIVGRKLSRSIAADAPVFWSDIKDAPMEKLSDKIGAERRAITLAVDDLSSVGYHIRPGDHVDIIGTFSPESLGAGTRESTFVTRTDDGRAITFSSPVSLILMQDVLVMAAGRSFSSSAESADADSNYSNITLDVSVEEAVLLTHARAQGNLSFVLRSPSSRNRMEHGEMIEVTDDTVKKYIKSLDLERAREVKVISGSDATHK